MNWTSEQLAERIAGNPDLKMRNNPLSPKVRNSPSRAPKRATEKVESVELLEKAVFFVIAGSPVAKPRQTRSDKWKQRACVMKYREWADGARRAMKKATGIERLLGAKKITANFYFPMPESWSKKKAAEMRGMPHRQKPDLDNCAKSLMDALIVNDETVFAVSIHKEWCVLATDAGKVEVMIS